VVEKVEKNLRWKKLKKDLRWKKLKEDFRRRMLIVRVNSKGKSQKNMGKGKDTLLFLKLF
jgi:hypothetical protein